MWASSLQSAYKLSVEEPHQAQRAVLLPLQLVSDVAERSQEVHKVGQDHPLVLAWEVFHVTAFPNGQRKRDADLHNSLSAEKLRVPARLVVLA
jgi:hypothetical protein